MKDIITDGTRCAVCEAEGIDGGTAGFGGVATLCTGCGRPVCLAHSIATGRRGTPRMCVMCADLLAPGEDDSDSDGGCDFDYDCDFLADARIGDLSDIEAGDELYALM